MKIETWPIDRPVPYARNARQIPEQAIAKVAASLKEFGWRQPLVVDQDGVLVVGHTRLLAAQRLGFTEVPVHIATDLSKSAIKAYRLMDNRSHQESTWQNDMLALELGDLKIDGFDLDLTGFNADELAALETLADSLAEDGTTQSAGDEDETKTLSDRFLVPPFSVLDARQGYWQERKRQWLAMGIKSELGRGGGLSQEARHGQPATTPISNEAAERGGRSKMALHNDPMQRKKKYG